MSAPTPPFRASPNLPSGCRSFLPLLGGPEGLFDIVGEEVASISGNGDFLVSPPVDAVTYDASTGRLSLANIPDRDPAIGASFSIWARMDVAGDRVLFVGPGISRYAIWVQKPAAYSKLSGQLYERWLNTGTEPVVGQWHHWCLVCRPVSGTNQSELYIDAVSRGVSAVGGFDELAATNNIGAFDDDTRNWDGGLHTALQFDRPLLLDEIQFLADPGYLAYDDSVAWMPAPSQVPAGGVASQATAWRLHAAAGQATAWQLRAGSIAATAWRLFTTSPRSTAWRVRTADALDTAWRARDSVSRATAWLVRTSSARATAWRVRAGEAQGTAWRIRATAARATAWRILSSGAATLDTAWRILAATATRDTAWRVKASDSVATAWHVRALAVRDTAWQILSSGVATLVTAWRLRDQASRSTAWRLRAAAARASAWRIRNVAGVPAAWRVRDLGAAATAWRVFVNRAQITAWRIGILQLTPSVIVYASPRARVVLATQR